MTRPTVEGEYVLHTYKVTYEDGIIRKVLGRYAPHAWAVAANMRPQHQVRSLELVK